jgi:hypothetical protein
VIVLVVNKPNEGTKFAGVPHLQSANGNFNQLSNKSPHSKFVTEKKKSFNQINLDRNRNINYIYILFRL